MPVDREHTDKPRGSFLLNAISTCWYLFLIAGLLVVGFTGLQDIWDTYKIDRNSIRATAIITSLQISEDSGGPDGHERSFETANIEYAFKVDGQRYTGTDNTAEGDERFDALCKGCEIVVEYESGKPDNNRIFSHHNRWALFLLIWGGIPTAAIIILVKSIGQFRGLIRKRATPILPISKNKFGGSMLKYFSLTVFIQIGLVMAIGITIYPPALFRPPYGHGRIFLLGDQKKIFDRWGWNEAEARSIPYTTEVTGKIDWSRMMAEYILAILVSLLAATIPWKKKQAAQPVESAVESESQQPIKSEAESETQKPPRRQGLAGITAEDLRAPKPVSSHTAPTSPQRDRKSDSP